MVVSKAIDRATARAIELLARNFEPDIRDAFLTAIRSARSQATLSTIEEAMRSLDSAAAIRAATAGLEFETMKETLAELIEASGERTTQALRRKIDLPPGRTLPAFDVVNPYAVLYARSEVGRLIRQVDMRTVQGIQNVIGHGIETGIAPRESAKQIKNMIGLTDYQTDVAFNYQAKLLAAGESNVGVKTQMYADKLLRQRALAIARSETIAAANGGQQAAWRAAADQGFLDKDVEQCWITAQDERTCEICKPMPGMKENLHVRLGGSFVTGDGRNVLKPPAHVACRCTVALNL
jgi:Phage Mu protein F like protein